MVRRRLKLLLILLVLPFAVVLGRLGSIQLDPTSHLEFLRQAEHTTVAFLPPSRGAIRDRSGRVLAENQVVFEVHLRFEALNPRARALDLVCRELSASGAEFSARDAERHLRSLVDVASVADAVGGRHGPEGWLCLIEGVPPDAAQRMDRRLGSQRVLAESFRGRFELRRAASAEAVESGALDLWCCAPAAMGMEVTLWRLAALLSPEEPRSRYESLLAAVEKTLDEVERRAERYVARHREAGRNAEVIERQRDTARGLWLREAWLLVEEAPLDVVAAIEYFPQLFPGIEVLSSTRRRYPYGEAAGALTGHLSRLDAEDIAALEASDSLLHDFTGLRSAAAFEVLRLRGRRRTDFRGSGGLEENYDARLRGQYGMRVTQIDNFNRPRRVLDSLTPRHGEALKTTLDAELQALLYTELRGACGPSGEATAGSAAVMELPSGAILASVGFPGFDPNRIREPSYLQDLEARWAAQTGGGWLLDRPRLHKLYPGSLFKLVTALAAIESGEDWNGPFSPSRRYPCAYSFPLNPRLHCGSRYGHGFADGCVNLREALQHSCNVYFYYLGFKHLSVDALRGWAWNLGFGRPTGIDLPRHAAESGFLAQEQRVHGEMGLCHYAIGQVYVEATALQVLRAVATVALRGQSVPVPYLVEPKAAGPLALSNAEAIEALREGMWRAVHQRGGTAHGKAGLEQFRVSCKTATAEYRSGEERCHAWIGGFAPFDAPRFAFVIVLERSPSHGGDACAPLARRLLDSLAASDPAVLMDTGSDLPRSAPPARNSTAASPGGGL